MDAASLSGKAVALNCGRRVIYGNTSYNRSILQRRLTMNTECESARARWPVFAQAFFSTSQHC